MRVHVPSKSLLYAEMQTRRNWTLSFGSVMLLNKWKSGLVSSRHEKVHWDGLTVWASAAGRRWGVRFGFETLAAAYVFSILAQSHRPVSLHAVALRSPQRSRANVRAFDGH